MAQRSMANGRGTGADIFGLGPRLLDEAQRNENKAQRKLLKALARRNQVKARRWECKLRERTIRLGVLRRLYAKAPSLN